MSVEADIEEITVKIAQLGESVKQAKTEKKPKEEWEPTLQQMLELKVIMMLVHVLCDLCDL